MGSGASLLFWAAVILGTVGAAAILAYAFGRPGSALRRLALVALAVVVWILAPWVAIVFIESTHPVV